MNNQLYPHNKAAYERVMKAFKTSNKTCICHPTGTGKSYIVAAVCQHFERVLVIAPNMFVLNQQEEALKYHKNVSYITYAWLMLHYADIKNFYDIIILDEFHRAGAEEWGTAVNILIETQPQAKVLGTTATPIRYLDNEKNMAKELFDNNIASTLSIAEAWHLKILPVPTYVTGFFTFDNIINTTTKRIKVSKYLDKESKLDRISRISNVKLEWQKSNGMVNILKKHLNKRVHRIIVFCAHIENLQGMQLLVKKWFRQSGFRISGTYMVHSSQSDREQMVQMKEFSQDNAKGIKLLFAINMLNEGVHIPDVDAVLMLRTTSSKIIYLQQLGRCLTAANTDKPLVLDMVDNISTTTVVSSLAEELANLEKKDSEEKEEAYRKDLTQTMGKFEIFDYTLTIRQMVEKLIPKSPSLKERLEEATKFCESVGRAPSIKYPEEYGQVLNWRILRNYIEKNPQVLELFVKYSNRINHSKVFKIKFLEFVKKYNKFPISKAAGEERNLYQFFLKHKEELLKDDEINEIYCKYCNINKKDIYYKEVLEFCKKHGRYPRKKNSKEKDALIAFNRFKDAARKSKKYKQLYRKLSLKYGKHSQFDKYLAATKQYVEKYGYLPCRGKEQVYYKWKFIKYRFKEHPEVQKLLEEYGEITKQKVSEIRSKKMKETRQNRKTKSVNLSM